MEKEILKVINDYDKALTLLDCYDHQTLIKPKGNQTIYKLDYNECRMLIDMMKFESSLFGVEKDGSFNSSINAIYQTAFGEEVYKSIEEKAEMLKKKTNELVELAKEKGTPVLEGVANDVREKAIAVTKEVLKKIENKA